MNRVINSAKYLKEIVRLNQPYYIGFGIENLTDIGKENSDLNDIISGRIGSAILRGKSGALKENTHGKFVRKEPWVKISKTIFIDYFNNYFGKQISYDREFNVWEKELLHRYNLPLFRAITPQNETILHFPIQTYIDTEEHYMLATVSMNIAIQLGRYYLLFDENYEPIIPVSKYKNRSILPSGEYSSVIEKMEAIEAELLNNSNFTTAGKGNSYRFALLKEKKPNEVTAGVGGFNDYLMFEFLEHDLMILENLKSGNATYIFRLSDFDKELQLNKSTARTIPSFKERVVHENMDEKNAKTFHSQIMK